MNSYKIIGFSLIGAGILVWLFGPFFEQYTDFTTVVALAFGLIVIGIILIILGAVIPFIKNHFKKTWICEQCNYALNSEVDLINHKNEKHLVKSQFKCEHCDYIGVTEQILWNHYNDKHPKEKKWEV